MGKLISRKEHRVRTGEKGSQGGRELEIEIPVVVAGGDAIKLPCLRSLFLPCSSKEQGNTVRHMNKVHPQWRVCVCVCVCVTLGYTALTCFVVAPIRNVCFH